MMHRSFAASAVVVALALASCGGSMDDGSPVAASSAQGNLITISGMTFSPARLTVAPGTTVTVRNMDATAHSVTSEPAMNDFHAGPMAGVSFDTGPFTGEMSFTIPASAPAGLTIPYFSTVDTSTMKTPNAEIAIAAMPTPMPMMPMDMPGM